MQPNGHRKVEGVRAHTDRGQNQQRTVEGASFSVLADIAS